MLCATLRPLLFLERIETAVHGRFPPPDTELPGGDCEFHLDRTDREPFEIAARQRPDHRGARPRNRKFSLASVKRRKAAAKFHSMQVVAAMQMSRLSHGPYPARPSGWSPTSRWSGVGLLAGEVRSAAAALTLASPCSEPIDRVCRGARLSLCLSETDPSARDHPASSRDSALGPAPSANSAARSEDSAAVAAFLVFAADRVCSWDLPLEIPFNGGVRVTAMRGRRPCFREAPARASIHKPASWPCLVCRARLSDACYGRALS
jgi:hypothetical protein